MRKLLTIKPNIPISRSFYFARENFWYLIIGLVFILPLLQSCSNTKFLTDDEKLYTYSWVTEKGFGKINNKPLKAYELYSVGSVKTNRSFLLLPRTKLAVYNYMKPSGNFGPRHYIYKVMAQPPVLLRDANPALRTEIMNQKLDEMGHFDSDVQYDLKVYGKHNKKARAKYHINFRTAYTYRNISFSESGRDSVDNIIATSFKNNILKTGNDYWLKEIELERERLTLALKNEGYYYFKPSYFQFLADTTVGNKQVDLKMLIKDKIPQKAFVPFKVSRVNIVVESNNKSSDLNNTEKPVFINNHYYTDCEKTFRPEIISKSISINPGLNYNLTHHDNTLRYLQGMGAFSTINIFYTKSDSIANSLAANVLLLPLKPIQTNIEANFSTKSNDFLGPAGTASISHLNLFGGAEKLVFQVNGGFEWQKRSKRKEYELGINSYEIGTSLKLTLPRFLVPFKIKKHSEVFVPTTYTSVGFRSLKRVQYYTMNLSQIKFGYNWQSTDKIEFKVEPVSIDYFHLSKKSQEFIDFLEQYPQVALSFEEQFVVGSQFGFTYSSHPKNKKLNYFHYDGTLELSGNILQAAHSITGSNDNQANEPNTFFDTPYAQYTKIKNDLRYYIYFNEKSQIAMRLVAGIGVPYNNSTVLPYAKQFFAGGSQDIRAFYARSIGPGSYVSTDSLSGGSFLDQSGEIKLLANFEYRFPITYKAFGALFVDAGNVWLINEDTSRPGGKFEFNSFMNEVAVGAGFGVRFDLDYFIIRLDAAIPIRKPYLTNKNAWIFNDSSFFKDYIFSLAVGYPF